MVIAIIALVGTAGALVAFSPTKAAGDVPIEAALKVGNHTQGITDKKSVNAWR